MDYQPNEEDLVKLAKMIDDCVKAVNSGSGARTLETYNAVIVFVSDLVAMSFYEGRQEK